MDFEMAENRLKVPLNSKVRPEIKAAAEAMAKEDRRSLTQWLEVLIEDEEKRRKAAGGKNRG